MAEVSLTSSDSANMAETVSGITKTVFSTTGDIEDNPSKKLKTIPNDRLRPLEDRIISILSCCICLDLSSLAMIQCVNGHLMCAACFNHLFADCTLKDEKPICPTCRCAISSRDCTRNLAVEKAISELPITCVYCSQICLRCEIKYHQSQMCPERPTLCEYSLLGCNWTGSLHSLKSHMTVCEYPNKTGQQLLDTIRLQKRAYEAEKKCLEAAVDLISLNEIAVSNLILKPIRTDDFDAKLYFETSSFRALEYQWQVRVRINDNVPHPHTIVTRSLSYQLALESEVSETIDVKFFLLKGPHSDPSALQIQPIIYHFEFNENKTETEYLKLPISSEECNRMLRSSSISFRLWLGQGRDLQSGHGDGKPRSRLPSLPRPPWL